MIFRKTILLLFSCCICNLIHAGYIPLEPGVVIVQAASLRKWQAVSDSKFGKTSCAGYAIVLSYYSKSGNGSYTLSRDLDIDCSGYDQLIYEANADYIPTRLFAVNGYIETDAGRREMTKQGSVTVKGSTYFAPSIKFDVTGVKRVKKLVLKVKLTKPGVASAQFRSGTFLLQNSVEYAAFVKHLERYSGLMDEFLQPVNYQPKFKLQYEIFFSNKQLDDYCKQSHFKTTNTNPDSIPSPVGLIYTNLGGSRDPLIRRFLATVGSRYASSLRGYAGSYAFRSLLYKDKGMMRVAARYMLAMAAFNDWADHPYSKAAGGNASAAFSASWCSTALAFALDCAGEMLNSRGKNYVLRALLFNGVANVTYSLWGRSYAMKMNQGISFLRGKLAALAVFNKEWPGVMPTIEVAKHDADRCIGNLFTENGGYLESLGYLDYTTLCTIPFYQIYSRIVNKPLLEVVPEAMKRSGNYAEIVASTCQRPGWITIPLGGQAHSCKGLSPRCASFLAAITPGSMWVNLYHKVDPKAKQNALRTFGSECITNRELFALADKAPMLKNLRNFILLKDNAFASSLRDFKGKKLKIVVVGDNDGIGKKNSDAGTFVIEFAGDAFAMQMPVYNGIYFEPQYRNTLVPITGKNMYGNQLYLMGLKNRASMLPVASGNSKSFKAKVDISNAWDKKYFTQSSIAIDSPTPDTVKISCGYTTGPQAKGAALMWITYLPVEMKGGKAMISGKYGGTAELSAPGCTMKVEKFTPSVAILRGMSMAPKTQCSRIVISRSTAAGKKDSIVVNCKLSVNGK